MNNRTLVERIAFRALPYVSGLALTVLAAQYACIFRFDFCTQPITWPTFGLMLGVFALGTILLAPIVRRFLK